MAKQHSSDQNESSGSLNTEGSKVPPESNSRVSQDKNTVQLFWSSYRNFLNTQSNNDFFMTLAVWMANFPVDDRKTEVDEKKSEIHEEKTKLHKKIPKADKKSPPEEAMDYKKVGAVLVLPNDVFYAADCTRNGVHAVTRLLMKHYDKAEDAKVFVSRKPCAMCTKLLMQSKVKQVFYQPLEDEYYPPTKQTSYATTHQEPVTTEQQTETDNLFTASAIGQTNFITDINFISNVITILCILNDMQKSFSESPVDERKIEDQSKMKKDEEKIKEDERKIEEEKSKLFKTKYNDEWTEMENAGKMLPWSMHNEEKKNHLKKCFEYALEFRFQPCGDQDYVDFDPINNLIHKKQAKHLLTMAEIARKRTGDPKKGVGAVIVSPEMEILSLGWNSFPQKALYGEYSRGRVKEDSKYHIRFTPSRMPF